jgi:hypothetical protein
MRVAHRYPRHTPLSVLVTRVRRELQLARERELATARRLTRVNMPTGDDAPPARIGWSAHVGARH